MKKKFLVIALGLVCLTVALQGLKTKDEVNDLLLMNVEALASGETGIPTDCYGTGSLTCPPSGRKVAYILTRWSLGDEAY